MGGDPVSTCFLRQFRRAHRVGDRSAARIPHGGDMVNIHAEAQWAYEIHGQFSGSGYERIKAGRAGFRKGVKAPIFLPI